MTVEPARHPVEVKVWGEWACFTRPELKVERVSYPVMTPAAARGMLEAIFWKRHLFRWVVQSITVLKPIQFSAIRRNEVEKIMGKNLGPIVADECRAQRNSLVLRDVGYIIKATIHRLGCEQKPIGHGNPYHEYKDRFDRNVARGRCWHRPCLGCREFAANFGPVTGDEEPIDRSEPLGLMFYDFFDIADPAFDQPAIPRYFSAVLDRGELKIDRTLVKGPLKELVEP